MTAFPHYAVQKAVYAALAAQTALTQALADGAASVVAHALPELALPYVLVAQTAVTPVLSVQDGLYDCSVTCDVASRQAGGAQARQITALVTQALSAPVSVAGYRVVVQQARETQVGLLGDGATYRGAVVLRLVLEETGAGA